MISGAHVLVYADDAPAARTFLRDVLGWDSVDDGGGWLIFALPSAELGVHPTADAERDSGDVDLYLMCRDIDATVAELHEKGVDCPAPVDRGFGLLTTLDVPGLGPIGLYEPKHKSPLDALG
jgi:catechol 2,3-dioxygenase-like lactoylglutathione lyase family enzyme